MTEIRKQAAPMAVNMAEAAIRQARRALTKNTGWNDVKRADYNLPEVEMASAVLFEMFETHEFAIRQALMRMPEELDGIHGRNYFDAFVESLGQYVQRFQFRTDGMVRTPDGGRHSQTKEKSGGVER